MHTWCPEKPEDSRSGYGVTEGWGLPDVGDGNGTQVLLKRSQ